MVRVGCSYPKVLIVVQWNIHQRALCSMFSRMTYCFGILILFRIDLIKGQSQPKSLTSNDFWMAKKQSQTSVLIIFWPNPCMMSLIHSMETCWIPEKKTLLNNWREVMHLLMQYLRRLTCSCHFLPKAGQGMPHKCVGHLPAQREPPSASAAIDKKKLGRIPSPPPVPLSIKSIHVCHRISSEFKICHNFSSTTYRTLKNRK